jgi:hypothetical protein
VLGCVVWSRTIRIIYYFSVKFNLIQSIRIICDRLRHKLITLFFHIISLKIILNMPQTRGPLFLIMIGCFLAINISIFDSPVLNKLMIVLNTGNTVQKKTCTSPNCGPTCNAAGCLNSGESHTVGVTASRSGYETDGAVSGSFTVNVYAANPPTFYYSCKLYFWYRKMQLFHKCVNSLYAT